MKFNADIMNNLKEITVKKREEKIKKKKLYLSFAITGWKVTISKDLKEGLFKDSTHLQFQIHKVTDESRGNRKDGTPFYKHQYLGIFGHKYSESEADSEKIGQEIRTKGTKGDTGYYYYVTLRKSVYAKIDKTLINTTNYVSSRQYTILEEATKEATKDDSPGLLLDMEVRSKKFYKIGYQNGKSPQQLEKAKKDKEEADKLEKKRKEQEQSKGSSKITQTASGAHQLEK